MSRKAFAGGIATLADGKLYALQHPFALDGRVSSYPASARGYSVANSYLLTQSRRRAADRHRLRQGRAGDPRRDRIADRAAAAAVDVPAAAQRVHVDQQRRDLRRAFQRRPVLHQQSRRGAVVRFRRQDERPQHPGRDEGHRGDARRHDRARQARPPDRRHAGADPADRHALAVRPRDQDAVQRPTCSPTSGATREIGPWIVTDADDDATTPARACARSCSTRATGGWRARRPTRSGAASARCSTNTTSRPSRRAMAASCAAARWWRGTTGCWMSFLKACDKSVAVSRYVTRDEER